MNVFIWIIIVGAAIFLFFRSSFYRRKKCRKLMLSIVGETLPQDSVRDFIETYKKNARGVSCLEKGMELPDEFWLFERYYGTASGIVPVCNNCGKLLPHAASWKNHTQGRCRLSDFIYREE